MNSIPIPNEGEELVVEWLQELAYRVIPTRISQEPTQVDTARKLVFASQRLDEFRNEVDFEFAKLPNPLSFQVHGIRHQAVLALPAAVRQRPRLVCDHGNDHAAAALCGRAVLRVFRFV